MQQNLKVGDSIYVMGRAARCPARFGLERGSQGVHGAMAEEDEEKTKAGGVGDPTSCRPRNRLTELLDPCG